MAQLAVSIAVQNFRHITPLLPTSGCGHQKKERSQYEWFWSQQKNGISPTSMSILQHQLEGLYFGCLQKLRIPHHRICPHVRARPFGHLSRCIAFSMVVMFDSLDGSEFPRMGSTPVNGQTSTTIVETNCCGNSLIARTVSCGLFYQAHYQRALQRCEDGVLSRIGLRMPSKSQAASMGSEEAFVRDVLKRPGGVGKTGENIGFFMGNLRRNWNGKLL